MSQPFVVQVSLGSDQLGSILDSLADRIVARLAKQEVSDKPADKPQAKPAQKQTKPKDVPPPKDEVEEGTEEKAEEVIVTRDEAIAKAQKLRAAKGGGAALKLLESFTGTNKFSDLKEEDFAAFVRAADDLMDEPDEKAEDDIEI